MNVQTIKLYIHPIGTNDCGMFKNILVFKFVHNTYYVVMVKLKNVNIPFTKCIQYSQ